MPIDTDKLRATLQRDLEALQQTREELCLQASLAKADAKSEWTRLETRLQRAQEEFARLGTHSKEAVQEVEKTARGLMDELKQGYERFRLALTHDNAK